MRQQQLGTVMETDEEAYGDQPINNQEAYNRQQQMMDDQAFLQQQ